MQGRAGKITLLLAVASLLVWSQAHSSVAFRLSLDQMAADAIVIARASVKSIQGYWEGKRIFTDVTLRVEDGIKGSVPGELLVVTQPGGIADGVGMNVHGMPEFREGEEVMVFLEQNRMKPAHYSVCGMKQGKFEIVENESGGKDVRRDMEGLALVDTTGSRAGAVEMPARLEDFMQALAALLHKQGEAR